jgi:hypothetical protein
VRSVARSHAIGHVTGGLNVNPARLNCGYVLTPGLGSVYNTTPAHMLWLWSHVNTIEPRVGAKPRPDPPP